MQEVRKKDAQWESEMVLYLKYLQIVCFISFED